MELTEATGRMTRDELAESLIFYRRRLVEKIVIARIMARPPRCAIDPREIEDLANAICERLAARETGKPEGYA